MATHKRLIVVLGMHRSGTSLITRALNVLGVDLGSSLMAPSEGNNEKGFFEDTDVNSLNTEMLNALNRDWHWLSTIEPEDIEALNKKGFFARAVDLLLKKTSETKIFGVKDPRIVRLLAFWQPVFKQCQFDVSYLLAIRNPLSVTHSLAKRDGFSSEKSYLLWLSHVLNGILLTQESKRVLIDYDQFLNNTKQGFELIAKRLALKINIKELQLFQTGFIEEKLRHHTYTLNDLALDKTCPPLALRLYSALADISLNNTKLDDPIFHKNIELWNEKFSVLKLNLRWVDDLLTQINNLHQTINFNDNKLKDIIVTALEEDKSIFKNSFNTDWYLSNNPDVAASNIDAYQHYIQFGVFEGRLPAPEKTTFIRDSLLNYSKELHSSKNRADSYFNQSKEIEKEHTQQLLQIQQTHTLQMQEQSNTQAEREQALLAQLSQTHQKIENQLSELANREKEHAQQLQEIQLAHKQQIQEQSNTHAELEQALLAQLTQTHQKVESQLSELANREKEHAQQLQQIQQTHKQQILEQSNTQAEREQALNALLLTKQDELYKQTALWTELEKNYNNSLTDVQYQLNQIHATKYWRLKSLMCNLYNALINKIKLG